jgi:radical SAM superfamily enzyme YgiQ (UPF0313 family)
MKKILLVNPETPATFWSFKNAIRFISKKASDIPLGLLTVASMLPQDWEKKFIDINIEKLHDKDIEWADYVFLGGMSIQLDSFKKTARRCNGLETPIIAGGPLVTTEHERLVGIDHLVLGEAESIMPKLVEDIECNNIKAVYQCGDFPLLDSTPPPMWNLLNQKKYAQMSIQYSRGCPFDCEFCSIVLLNGRNPRTKSKAQLLAELQSLYESGWRGNAFIVDDNFIGKKQKLKKEVLPALINWSQKHRYPFQFTTEASINLADDIDLLKLMVKAGFTHIFIGIETPNHESLAECGKAQNQKLDMIDAVKLLQKEGLRVSGGFIVGFDHDPPSIFEQQISFIQKSGIVTAMVGLLNAPTGTKLFNRLKSEDRLLNLMSGDNMDGSINFIPKMKYQELIKGYKQIVTTIYSPKAYYERVKLFLKEYKMPVKIPLRIKPEELHAFFRSIWKLGILENGRRYYWKLVFYTLFNHPRKFPTAITMAIYGFHFRKVIQGI